MKTGRGLGAGTDAKFWLQIVESEGHNVTFVLDGNEEKLERNRYYSLPFLPLLWHFDREHLAERELS